MKSKDDFCMNNLFIKIAPKRVEWIVDYIVVHVV